MVDEPARSAGGALGEYAYVRTPGERERSMSDVVKDIISNVQEIVRSEVRLARAEMRDELRESMAAGKLMAAGAGLGFFAALFGLVAIALLLGMVMSLWLSFLIVSAVLGIAGMALLSKGRSKFVVPKPNKTIENVRENVQWMKDQTRS
jgi:uncharacterized membrane protein YqjE